MITHLKFVSIPTRDQERALRFWTEQVGFSIKTDQRFDETQRWIELRIPGAETRLVLFTPTGHEDRVGSFAPASFWTDDIDATYERLVAAGVELCDIQLPTPHTLRLGAQEIPAAEYQRRLRRALR